MWIPPWLLLIGTIVGPSQPPPKQSYGRRRSGCWTRAKVAAHDPTLRRRSLWMVPQEETVGSWVMLDAEFCVGPPTNNLGILFNVKISWIPGVFNKKSLEKKGFQLKSIYGQLIFLLNLLIERNLVSIEFQLISIYFQLSFNWFQFTFNWFCFSFNWYSISFNLCSIDFNYFQFTLSLLSIYIYFQLASIYFQLFFNWFQSSFNWVQFTFNWFSIDFNLLSIAVLE